MNKRYYEHGDLYWINLRPFFDKYVLVKIIDYNYFGPASKNSKYVYVYDCFVKELTDKIPPKKERLLYMEPFNFREFYIIAIESIYYIKPECVELTEIKYSFSISRRMVDTETTTIVNTKNGMSSYLQQFSYEELFMLENDSQYSEHQIQTRIVHEVFKNEDKVYVKSKTKNKIDLDNIVMSSEELYENFIAKTNIKFLNRPSYMQLEEINKLSFQPNWDKEYPNYDPDSKTFTIWNSWNSDYEFGFKSNLIPEYRLLKPHYEKLGIQVSGGSVVALVVSIIHGDNNYLTQIDQAHLKIIGIQADSFSLSFGSEAENIAVMDFYKNEILNPKNLDHFMTFMNESFLKLYYTVDIPFRLGKLIRFEIEDYFLDVLDKFRMAKDEVDYSGITINVDELRDHLGFDINLETLYEITSVAMQKKYKLAIFRSIDSMGYFDVYMKDSIVANKFYKFLKRSFKNIDTFKKMKISLKLEGSV